ncbi:MAG: exosortase/archaeosortase family protein [Phycisphaerales bacterium]|nr:exosortase/archaeosortase family protein [Phycisphaerales bacterium]
MIPTILARQGWTIWHLLGAAVLCGAAVAFTWPAWVDIVRIATADEEQSHVFLVPVVALWMVWARRLRFRFCPPKGTMIGPPIVAVGWILSSVGFNNSIQSFWHGGAVLIAIGSVLSVFGKHVLFRFLPAFAVLVFLVPTPGGIRQAISGPLQTATAFTTQAILETVGVPVERSGNLLTINGIDVAVAEACNGMRMVFAVVLVSYAFAFGMPLRNFTRLVVLVASPIAALICNIIRLLPTVVLYGYSPQSTANAFHDISGWLMLPAAFMLLLGVMRVLNWAQIPVNRYTLAYQ